MKTVKYAIIYDDYNKEYMAYEYTWTYKIFGDATIWDMRFEDKTLEELKDKIVRYHEDLNKRKAKTRFKFIEIYEVK